MKNDEELPYRRSVRLQSYDYSHTGAYFVTICTEEKRCRFGAIVNGESQLNNLGQIARQMWLTLPKRFHDVTLDQYVVMPNHVHGILIPTPTDYYTHADSYAPKVPERFQTRKTKDAGAINLAPTRLVGQAGAINLAPTLGEVVRTFKALVTYHIRKSGIPDFAWQRGFHESVLKNEKHLAYVRQYILDNPSRWTEDNLFPEQKGAK